MFCGGATEGGVAGEKFLREHWIFTQPATCEKRNVFWGGKNGAIYTHFLHSQRLKNNIFLGSEMVPYAHIFMQPAAGEKEFVCFWGGSKWCHIYTFLEFIFFRKNKKKQ
jgi:hypothetical protein